MIGELIRQIETLKRRIESLETQEAPRRVYWPFTLAEGGMPVSASPVTWMSTAQPSNVTITPLRWTVRTWPVAPNDGGNYWTVYLLDTAGLTLASFNTSADPGGAGTRHELTTFVNVPVAATNHILRVHVQKTGNPGALYGSNQLLVQLGS